MDFNKYCRRCGRQVEEIEPNDGMRQFQCECTNRPLIYTEVMAGHTRNARVAQLKAMHQLMLQANDETIYHTWTYTMPDEPSEEDFVDVALDDEQYNHCFDLFVKLIAKEGNRY